MGFVELEEANVRVLIDELEVALIAELKIRRINTQKPYSFRVAASRAGISLNHFVYSFLPAYELAG